MRGGQSGFQSGFVSEHIQEQDKRIIKLQAKIAQLEAEKKQAIKFLEDALPHITCINDFQSGLITAIGTFLQALQKEKEE